MSRWPIAQATSDRIEGNPFLARGFGRARSAGRREEDEKGAQDGKLRQDGRRTPRKRGLGTFGA